MTVTTAELRPLLKRLKLGPMLDTLPKRIALARRDGLDYADFLQIVLADEVSRRDHGRLELRLRQAGFEQLCRLEDFDWSAQVRLDRRLLDAACSLRFLDRREHVLLVGPAGVGKSFLAQALCYAAVRSGHSVRFVTADQYFRELAQARVDHSTEKAFRSFLAPDLLDPATTSGCTGSAHSSRSTSTSWSSAATAAPASSSPPTALSRSGSASSTTRSSATAPSTGSPTPATRS